MVADVSATTAYSLARVRQPETREFLIASHWPSKHGFERFHVDAGDLPRLQILDVGIAAARSRPQPRTCFVPEALGECDGGLRHGGNMASRKTHG